MLCRFFIDAESTSLFKPESELIHMRYILLIIFALLVSACQDNQDASATVTEHQALSSDDPGYVAENPRLAGLVGQPGPAITLQTIDGKTIDLLDVYGKKPVYLKLWATYCIPCRVQMPGFEKIYQTYGDKMQIVGVNAGVGDDVDKVKAFMEEMSLHMSTAIDDGSLGAWLEMQETPLHLLIDLDGRIAHAGHQDGAKLDAAIEKVLSSSASGAPIETAAVERLAAINVGDSAPGIDLRSSDDTVLRFQSGASDRPRAIYFTATWCEDYLQQTYPEDVESCKRVRKEVDQLAQSGQVEWLGVVSHLWTTPDSLAEYLGRTKHQVKLSVDSDGTAFRVFGIHRFPAVALIDIHGKLVRIVGPDDTDLKAAIEQLEIER